jgi:predicted RNA-binding Zn ribbon-like protein
VVSARFRSVTGTIMLNGYDCIPLRVTCQQGYGGYAMNGEHTHTADIDTTADFLNTLSIDDGAPVEHLLSASDAIAFLAGSGLAHDETLRAQAAETGERTWLERVRLTRSALRALWDAEVEHRVPDGAAIGAVNAVLREAPRIELVLGENCCGVGHHHTAEDPTGEALARLVEPFVAAVAAGTTGRLRICANDDCRWAFEDTSRAGRRRWCDMTSCGNVAKARRYRARRKGAPGEAKPWTGGELDAAAEGSTAAG